MDQLTDEQILVQLTESRDALAPYGTDEFVLPFGSYNDTVLAINDSHGLFSVLTTVDYGWTTATAAATTGVTSEITRPRSSPGWRTRTESCRRWPAGQRCASRRPVAVEWTRVSRGSWPDRRAGC